MKPEPVGRGAGHSPARISPVHPNQTPGILAGTPVLTLDGEKPVETLAPGDRVITRDTGMARLKALNSFVGPMHLISIAAGSLGDTRPEQDLVLPGAQLVLIRDWRAQALFGKPRALVRADRLTDGEFIRDFGVEPREIYQICFDRAHIVYAGGLELASLDPAVLMSSAA